MIVDPKDQMQLEAIGCEMINRFPGNAYVMVMMLESGVCMRLPNLTDGHDVALMQHYLEQMQVGQVVPLKNGVPNA